MTDQDSFEFREIGESNELKLQAAKLLRSGFSEFPSPWPTMARAMEEVEDCEGAPKICIGICRGEKLLGWVGLRPMYEKTWELHPLVVAPDERKGGIGTLLLGEVEREAMKRGIEGIILGADDDYCGTSLSQVDVEEGTIFDELRNIRNLADHPYEFYLKCGYMIVGMIPNANGPRRPDIWMWKGLV